LHAESVAGKTEHRWLNCAILHPTQPSAIPLFVSINPDTGNKGDVYINEVTAA
jgi:hypothetical protein